MKSKLKLNINGEKMVAKDNFKFKSAEEAKNEVLKDVSEGKVYKAVVDEHTWLVLQELHPGEYLLR